MQKLGVEVISFPHCAAEQNVDTGEDNAWSVQPFSFPSCLSIEPSRSSVKDNSRTEKTVSWDYLYSPKITFIQSWVMR